jgi:sulfur-carrier protein adenylyltransferase/sulfurtransferase
MESSLTFSERTRYSRHILMPEVGLRGQQKLKASAVLIVGAGGLGSPLALYLAAAGVGRLGIVDHDEVDESNLHRQVIHGSSDIGRSKLDSAADTLLEINPLVEIQKFDAMLSSENALDIIRGFDVVADGTDNFPTRYLINDACVFLGVPNVYASVYRFEGQVSVFGAPEGPCYRCLYPKPPPPGLVPSCAEGGVLGVVPGTVGTLQATEVIKLLIGAGDPLVGRLLLYDALDLRFQTVAVPKNLDCPVCGDQPSITELIDYQEFCGFSPAHSGAASEVPSMSVRELKRRVDTGASPHLLDVRDPAEADIATLGSPLIPLTDLESRLGELESWRNEEIVVYCRTGVRSLSAIRILERHGFVGAVNLTGGIRAWSEEIDRNVPSY